MLRVILAALISCSTLAFSVQADEINVSGSTSVARVMDVLAEHYNNQQKQSFIAVHGTDSTSGIMLLKKGISNIAMSSRYLTEGEKDEDLKIDVLALDGLAVVVNINNPVKSLTRKQLSDIYSGTLTNWKELGGQDKRIAVVTREASSGTRYSFETLLGLTKVIKDQLVSTISPNALVANSNGMVKTLVNHNPQAIGFISYGSVDMSVHSLLIDDVDGNAETIADRQYPLTRPFLILHYPEKDTANVKSFLTYLKSREAQKIIQDYGYVPMIQK